MSNDITRKSFWTQRLQEAEASSAVPAFINRLDGVVEPQKAAGGDLAAYGRTKAVMAVDAGELAGAASMHHLSTNTLILAAWAVLLRSYAGEDGPVSFGVCLDREQAAWLTTIPLSGADQLLGTMQAAERDMKLTLDHSLAFHSLGAFAEGTGCGFIETAVYIHSWKPMFPEMHLPVSHLSSRPGEDAFRSNPLRSRMPLSSSTLPRA